eukprot:48091-Amphidinium_carterae.1
MMGLHLMTSRRPFQTSFSQPMSFCRPTVEVMDIKDISLWRYSNQGKGKGKTGKGKYQNQIQQWNQNQQTGQYHNQKGSNSQHKGKGNG